MVDGCRRDLPLHVGGEQGIYDVIDDLHPYEENL